METFIVKFYSKLWHILEFYYSQRWQPWIWLSSNCEFLHEIYPRMPWFPFSIAFTWNLISQIKRCSFAMFPPRLPIQKKRRRLGGRFPHLPSSAMAPISRPWPGSVHWCEGVGCLGLVGAGPKFYSMCTVKTSMVGVEIKKTWYWNFIN